MSAGSVKLPPEVLLRLSLAFATGAALCCVLPQSPPDADPLATAESCLNVPQLAPLCTLGWRPCPPVPHHLHSKQGHYRNLVQVHMLTTHYTIIQALPKFKWPLQVNQ